MKDKMMRKFRGIKTVRNIGLLKGLWTYRTEFVRMLRSVFTGKHHLHFLTIIAVIGSLFYIFSPIDFLPDFIPVVGWMDDGIIFYFLLKRLLKETLLWAEKQNSNLVILPSVSGK